MYMKVFVGVLGHDFLEPKKPTFLVGCKHGFNRVKVSLKLYSLLNFPYMCMSMYTIK